MIITDLPDGYEEALRLVNQQPVIDERKWLYKQIIYTNPYTGVVYSLRLDTMFCGRVSLDWGVNTSKGGFLVCHGGSTEAYATWVKLCLTI
jgi:hypothetical protein